MGVTISATNSNYSFDMGYGGFFNLRKNIAMAIDKEFGDNYALLGACCTDQEFEEIDKAAEHLIRKKNLDHRCKDVLDFLYMPDSDGEISHRACKQIYDLIKDVDFGDKGFRYEKHRGDDYEDFKKFLMECYSSRRKMRWS